MVCLGTHRIFAKVASAEIATAAGAVLLNGEVCGTPVMLRAGQASVMIDSDPTALDPARAGSRALRGSRPMSPHSATPRI